MNPKPLRQVDLFSDAGRLEALYREIEDPRGVAVVCHPHPVHGGTLHNKVVFRVARGLESAGVATLRFNFRGAGLSQGQFDEGKGEMRDFDAALRWVLQKQPGRTVIAGGFSFGSWISTRASCDNPDVDALFLIGTPVNKYDFGFLRDCPKPKLFVHGTEDEFGDADKVSALAETLPNTEIMIVTGAGHFFDKQLDLVEQALRDWATELIA
ncbi:MAG: alpha/beta fold hydrolase [Acidobacteriota bacterium]